MNMSIIYGQLLILLGLILALYHHLKSITAPSNAVEDGMPLARKRLFSWFAFFSLTVMGTVIILLGSFADIVSFRFLWIFTKIGDGYKMDISLGYGNNFLLFAIDLFFIIVFYYAMILFITRVGSNGFDRANFDEARFDEERISVNLSAHEIFVFAFGHYYVWILFSIIFFIFQVSILLILLSLIPTLLFTYIFKHGQAH